MYHDQGQIAVKVSVLVTLQQGLPVVNAKYDQTRLFSHGWDPE
jgi:4-hydroxy-L-threonine phosphate dehydrogenase PdxA